MSDDTLKTFDNLSSISNQDIDDALDIIPISHGVGTISQGDKKVKIGQLQQMTVLRCRTDGNVANKQAEYVGGLPLNGNSQACIGRTVLVVFENKNTAAEPTFSFKNLTGPIILLNQASNVTLGSGCVLANSRNIMTWDGQNWCLHSDIAEITSDYTKYADGTFVYNKNAIDSKVPTLEYKYVEVNGLTSGTPVLVDDTKNWLNANACVWIASCNYGGTNYHGITFANAIDGGLYFMPYESTYNIVQIRLKIVNFD